MPADSVWTKRECRKRACGQAGDNAREARCPRLAHTHSPFAHTAPLPAEDACGATTTGLCLNFRSGPILTKGSTSTWGSAKPLRLTWAVQLKFRGKLSWTWGPLYYDLRRLRLHGLIERIPHSHRYRVTDLGLRVALFFTKVHSRILRPGLSQLFDGCPKAPNRPIATAMRRLQEALGALFDQAKLEPCKI